jgi:hypothetical protein
MQTAHEQGTLVLLQNLDPSYTSAEVEVILILKFIFFTSLSSSIPSCFTSQPCCSKTLHVQFSYGKVDISTPPPPSLSLLAFVSRFYACYAIFCHVPSSGFFLLQYLENALRLIISLPWIRISFGKPSSKVALRR